MSFLEQTELSASDMTAMWENQGWNGENPHKADFSPLVLNPNSVAGLQAKANEYQERNDLWVVAAGCQYTAPEARWRMRGRTGQADYAYNAMRIAIISELVQRGMVKVEEFADLAKQAANAGFDFGEFVYYFGQAWGVVGAYNSGETGRLYQR